MGGFTITAANDLNRVPLSLKCQTWIDVRHLQALFYSEICRALFSKRKQFFSDKRIFVNNAGQSILEFLLMLPVLVSLAVILVRINSAIQVSIVNQKYARSQALFLTFNNAFYPELKYQDMLVQAPANQLVVGVADEPAPQGGGDYSPKASQQLIARSQSVQASDEVQSEPKLRAKVRIRDTVTLCTPILWVSNGGKPQAIMLPGGSGMSSGGGPSALNEGTKFDNICGSPLKYE